jgi:hypothetical protein
VQLRVPTKNPPVRERVGLVNARLRSADDTVRLVVDPKCKELTLDFESVSYKADTGEIDKDRDGARTHLSDALGYLLWQLAHPEPKIGERPLRGRLF